MAVDGYFTPLLEFISSSALWSRIGEIDTLGDTSAYVDFLKEQLERLGTLSSFSMTDSEANELVLYMPEDEEAEWHVTKVDAEDSLSSIRERNNIRYSSIGKDITSGTTAQESETLFRISTPYLLPDKSLPFVLLGKYPIPLQDMRISGETQILCRSQGI